MEPVNISADESPLMVFISSVMNKDVEDLELERLTAKDSITRISLARPWLFEFSPPSSDPVVAVYLEKVRQCDIFVCILGDRITYPVQQECLTAQLHGRPMLFFIRNATSTTPNVTQFLSQFNCKWRRFDSAGELNLLVGKAVVDELIKGFRAQVRRSYPLSGEPEALISDAGRLLAYSQAKVREEIKAGVGPKFLPELHVARALEETLLQLIAYTDVDFQNLRKTAADELRQAVLANPGQSDPSRDQVLRLLSFATPSELCFLYESLGRVVLDRRERQLIAALYGVVVVLGASGNGKTNLLCNAALLTSVAQPCVFINGAFPIEGERGLERRVLAGLGVDSEHDLDRWEEFVSETLGHRKEQVVVFIDAINENSDVPLTVRALKRCVASKLRTVCRFIISCRDVSWDQWYLPFALQEVIGRTLHLGEFSVDESTRAIELYLTQYGIKASLGDDALARLRHPLLLRFFCEAFGERGGPQQTLGEVPDFSLKAVFDHYLRKKTANIALRLGDSAPFRITSILHNTAEEMLASKSPEIPFSRIIGDSPEQGTIEVYQALVDEYIILETSDAFGARFVYDEFMSYCLGKFLAKLFARTTRARLATRITKLEKEAQAFPAIYQALAYAAIELRSTRNLWPYLVAGSMPCKISAASMLVQAFYPSYAEEEFRSSLELAKTTPMLPGIDRLGEAIQHQNPEKSLDLWATLARGGNVTGVQRLGELFPRFPAFCASSLIELLSSPFPDVVLASVFRLSEQNYSIPPTLSSKLLEHPDELVRLAALWARGKNFNYLFEDLNRHPGLLQDGATVMLAWSHARQRDGIAARDNSFVREVAMRAAIELDQTSWLELLHLWTLDGLAPIEEVLYDALWDNEAGSNQRDDRIVDIFSIRNTIVYVGVLPEEGAMGQLLKEEVEKTLGTLGTLTNRRRKIVSMLFGVYDWLYADGRSRTVSEVALELGTSAAVVENELAHALDSLRQALPLKRWNQSS